MKIFLTLLLALSLNAAGFWTLTGLQKANVYVDNQLSIIKPETLETIKERMAETLTKHKIAMNQQDSSTLMLSLEEIAGDDDLYYVYMKLSLGEDVQTFRKDREATFSLTFQATDFIETQSDTLSADVLESLTYLLGSFSELYEEDNE